MHLWIFHHQRSDRHCSPACWLYPIHLSSPRYLYWTDWGDHSLIGKIGMDGGNRSVIVDTKITWPNGLTLDYINGRIYWADAREDYIEFASLDGSNRHIGEGPARAVELNIHLQDGLSRQDHTPWLSHPAVG